MTRSKYVYIPGVDCWKLNLWLKKWNLLGVPVLYREWQLYEWCCWLSAAPDPASPSRCRRTDLEVPVKYMKLHRSNDKNHHNFTLALRQHLLFAKKKAHFVWVCNRYYFLMNNADHVKETFAPSLWRPLMGRQQSVATTNSLWRLR